MNSRGWITKQAVLRVTERRRPGPRFVLRFVLTRVSDSDLRVGKCIEERALQPSVGTHQ